MVRSEIDACTHFAIGKKFFLWTENIWFIFITFIFWTLCAIFLFVFVEIFFRIFYRKNYVGKIFLKKPNTDQFYILSGASIILWHLRNCCYNYKLHSSRSLFWIIDVHVQLCFNAKPCAHIGFPILPTIPTNDPFNLEPFVSFSGQKLSYAIICYTMATKLKWICWFWKKIEINTTHCIIDHNEKCCEYWKMAGICTLRY